MLKTLVIKLGSSSSRENYQSYYNIIEQNIFKGTSNNQLSRTLF